MEVVTSLPTRERVADVLRKAIFQGTLRPGQELKQAELAQQLGISRIPVREALQMLERDGLILVQGNRRAIVSPITDYSISDHYDIRSMLEGEAAARASMHPEKFEALVGAQAAVEAVARQRQMAEYVRLNKSFHNAIWEAAGSAQLVAILENLWKGLPPHLPELLPDQMDRSIIEHRKIVDAIKSGIPEVARSAMSKHVIRSLHDFLEHRAAVANRDIQPMPAADGSLLEGIEPMDQG